MAGHMKTLSSLRGDIMNILVTLISLLQCFYRWQIVEDNKHNLNNFSDQEISFDLSLFKSLRNLQVRCQWLFHRLWLFSNMDTTDAHCTLRIFYQSFCSHEPIHLKIPLWVPNRMLKAPIAFALVQLASHKKREWVTNYLKIDRVRKNLIEYR